VQPPLARLDAQRGVDDRRVAVVVAQIRRLRRLRRKCAVAAGDLAVGIAERRARLEQLRRLRQFALRLLRQAVERQAKAERRVARQQIQMIPPQRPRARAPAAARPVPMQRQHQPGRRAEAALEQLREAAALG
jgi:capsule polysaccharide export protein KpsE/RkpR